MVIVGCFGIMANMVVSSVLNKMIFWDLKSTFQATRRLYCRMAPSCTSMCSIPVSTHFMRASQQKQESLGSVSDQRKKTSGRKMAQMSAEKTSNILPLG